jgi:CheY-like chemotaxis protein
VPADPSAEVIEIRWPVADLGGLSGGQRLVRWPFVTGRRDREVHSIRVYCKRVTGVAPRKILVVDDQPMLAKAIRRMLTGHDVTVVGSAQEALTKLSAGDRYDVILSDLMMPGMSGMELHAAIGKLAPDQVTRMVFMTGGAFTPEARVFFDEVGSPTLEKPFDRAGLLAVIDNLLG